ncbi:MULTISPECIES: malonic semialdehyde reductase [unclassified Pseudomonas]|uniref:malonic semialdehyde reductase n=1 Tax=unclassified Pseudomonas TaxID=196821 RepID=UPI0021C647B8|nr:MULTISPECIES: malonic semialdehyde reductase [unclassified Pseudomonas]MCU1733616.1 malonic semialdehyde reductase [Pseudomonas sp. 20P_3.2_Bac4]MCU1743280.1 malonic semialdehyde reductase [Pseudomonas sp. 20P_3.2_Bac5]
MSEALTDQAIDQLFLGARSHNGWLEKPVDDGLLEQLYSVLSQGPTANNCNPARFVFVQSEDAKQRLLPALKGANGEKMLAAPVTVIIAIDSQFLEFLPHLFTAYDLAAMLRDDPVTAAAIAFRNSSLQGAYLILAARALGLDCGPMSGFDSDKVDDAFFPDGRWKTNFLCSLGYGDVAKLRPKGPRLSFEQSCRIV